MLALLIAPIFDTLNIDFSFAAPLISGFLEITNGINSISNIACKKISINIIFTAFTWFWWNICITTSFKYHFKN